MEIGRILDITRDSRASEGDSYIIDFPCRSLRLQTGFFSLSTNASRLQQLLNNNSVSSLYLYDVKIELSASTALSQAIAANVNLRTLFSINRHEVPVFEFAFLATNSNLLVVHVHQFNLNELGSENIISGLRVNRTIVELHLECGKGIDELAFWSIFKSIMDNNVVRKLGLVRLLFDLCLDIPEDALASLKANTSLIYLNLSRNSLGLDAFYKIIFLARFIKELVFSRNRLDCWCGQVNFDAMIEGFAALNSLTSLNLDCNIQSTRLFLFLCDAIRVNNSISSLSVANLCIAEDKVTFLLNYLTESLKLNATITSLSLEGLRCETIVMEGVYDEYRLERLRGIADIVKCLKNRAHNLLIKENFNMIIASKVAYSYMLEVPTISTYLWTEMAQTLVHLSLEFCGLKSKCQKDPYDANGLSFCILRRSDKLLSHESILDDSDLDERLPSIYYASRIVGTTEECSSVCLVPIPGANFDNSDRDSRFIFPNDYRLPHLLDENDITTLLSKFRSLKTLNLARNGLMIIDYSLFLLPHLEDLSLQYNNYLCQPALDDYKPLEGTQFMLNTLRQWALRKLILQRRSHFREEYSLSVSRPPASLREAESKSASDSLALEDPSRQPASLPFSESEFRLSAIDEFEDLIILEYTEDRLLFTAPPTDRPCEPEFRCECPSTRTDTQAGSL